MRVIIPRRISRNTCSNDASGVFLSAASTAFSATWPLVAEVDQRRQQIAAQIVAGRGLVGLSGGRRRGQRQAVLQLQPDALGGLLADAGNARQARDVLRADRADQIAGIDSRQHRQRELRADAADRDQPLEEVLLERGGKAVERDDVLAHVRVDAQRDARRRARRGRRTWTAARGRRSRRRRRRPRSGDWVSSRASVPLRRAITGGSRASCRLASYGGGAPPARGAGQRCARPGDRAVAAVDVADRDGHRVGRIVRRRRRRRGRAAASPSARPAASPRGRTRRPRA